MHIPHPSHATVVAYVALFVALSGTAVAATGGTAILGATNKADRITTFQRASGTPLQLRTGNGAAALKVNSTGKVVRLNADLLDGADGSTYLRSLCAADQAPTRSFRCTSSYMRHVPIQQPLTPQGTVQPGTRGVGFADCEGNVTLGGGFVLGGASDRLDVVASSAPFTPQFRPLGWRVELVPNAANGGVINAGSFAYAICLKGNV
jgi:hypothetical protein